MCCKCAANVLLLLLQPGLEEVPQGAENTGAGSTSGRKVKQQWRSCQDIAGA
jgi:hypothetical protein